MGGREAGQGWSDQEGKGKAASFDSHRFSLLAKNDAMLRKFQQR
jgi:hypothetical protein